VLAGPPRAPVTLNSSLRELVDGREYEVVWCNELGGLTLRVGRGASAVYVKWLPAASGADVAGELERLVWAGVYTPTPRVVGHGRDATGSWFLTQAIEAQNAVSVRWRGDPLTATTALGEGLRALHESLPRRDCPFEWSVATRLTAIEERVRGGALEGHEFDGEFAGLTLTAALDELRAPPREDLVVCHGDACAPNTLIDADGRWAAHLDFDQLGVGDRWADLAVASWSTVWNYGPGYEQNVFDAYGIEPDPDRIRYYRLLWELG
jgi:aminoglycoside phosphotransferase